MPFRKQPSILTHIPSRRGFEIVLSSRGPDSRTAWGSLSCPMTRYAALRRLMIFSWIFLAQHTLRRQIAVTGIAPHWTVHSAHHDGRVTFHANEGRTHCGAGDC